MPELRPVETPDCWPEGEPGGGGGVDHRDALRRLQARSAVPLGFSPESIPANLRVSCSCIDKTVQEALETLLDGTGLIFTGRRNQILVTRPDEPEPPHVPRNRGGLRA